MAYAWTRTNYRQFLVRIFVAAARNLQSERNSPLIADTISKLIVRVNLAAAHSCTMLVVLLSVLLGL